LSRSKWDPLGKIEAESTGQDRSGQHFNPRCTCAAAAQLASQLLATFLLMDYSIVYFYNSMVEMAFQD
jgi:hypothetical protein